MKLSDLQKEGLTLLRDIPYKVTKASAGSRALHLNPDSGFRIGDRVYQFRSKEGFLVIVPADDVDLRK